MLGVVLIDYNSQQRTVQYISDLLEASDIAIDSIAVIDNTPGFDNYRALAQSVSEIGFQTDIVYEEIQEKAIDEQLVGYIDNTRVFIVHSKENLGFARANNLGLRLIKHDDDIEYVLFSNSDILFIEKKVELGFLIDVLKKNETGFLVGPQVVYPDGRPQTPCRYLSIYRRWWRNSLMWPFNIPLKPTDSELITGAKEGKVYRIIGAFMLADVKKLEEVGCFDESTFLYAEELILAEKGKKYGYDVLYTPRVKIIHENGFTVRKVKTPASRDFKIRTMLQSDLYYYRNYIGVADFIISLTKVVVDFYLLKLHIKDAIVRWIGERHWKKNI